jgi:hypothetical protein
MAEVAVIPLTVATNSYYNIAIGDASDTNLVNDILAGVKTVFVG